MSETQRETAARILRRPDVTTVRVTHKVTGATEEVVLYRSDPRTGKEAYHFQSTPHMMHLADEYEVVEPPYEPLARVAG